MSVNVRVCVCACVCVYECGVSVYVPVYVSARHCVYILTSQAAIPHNPINSPFSNNLLIHTLNLNFRTSIRANVVFFLALLKSRLWRV